MTDAPARISTPEVCELAQYSPSTLWKRIDAGLMPAPIDRGGRGFLFDRQAVRAALGMDKPHEVATEAHDASITAEEFREALARQVRRGQGKGWRDRPRLLPGAGTPPALRLVSSHPATTH